MRHMCGSLIQSDVHRALQGLQQARRLRPWTEVAALQHQPRLFCLERLKVSFVAYFKSYSP